MEIRDVYPEEYAGLFPHPQSVYGSARFVALNAHKVSQVRCLCLSDEKPRLGLIVGVDADGSARAPFSAPFAGFDFNRRQSVETMQEAVNLLRRELPGLRLTLPPPFYSPDMNYRTQCALLTAGCNPVYTDWNFHIPLDAPVEQYVAGLDAEARKKLRKSGRTDYRVAQVNSDPERAYRVIEINRRQHGYPLRMSLEDVVATTGGDNPIVKADFFVLTNGVSDVAAAMVYEAAPGIAQVIYWGNDLRVTDCPGPVNRLAVSLYEYYSALGVKILDIGPSSIDGIPSPGLCRFKDSVGCQVTPKPTFVL